MDRNYNIACVVVTYNRKKLLKRCIDAIAAQSFKPTTVFIVDNASTDGTIESVKEWGYYNCKRDDIVYKYMLNSKNEGGAGGFYLGMKTAYDDNNYDGIWVMDDDGEPDKNCLSELVPYLDKYHYVAPIVLSDEDHVTCSFAPNFENAESFANMKGVKDGIIEDWASPFNAVLFSRALISRVGLPKKEMFIWGDEVNYHLRAKNSGYTAYTIMKAIHYHPLNRQEYNCVNGRCFVKNISADWKLYCYLRNLVYNEYRVANRFPKNIVRAVKISYIVTSYYVRQGKSLSLLLSSTMAGLLGYFGGLKKFFI